MIYDHTMQRLANTDALILDWQRKKYAEDAEWHPRPRELWQYIMEDGANWICFGGNNDDRPLF